MSDAKFAHVSVTLHCANSKIFSAATMLFLFDI